MKKAVVILGAGFAGLRLARKLSNKKNFDVILIDRLNYHQFQPLLYQVATAGLEPSDIAFPLRRIFQKSRNVHVRFGDILGVDTLQQKVICSGFEEHYDLLVIATGANSNFFGNKEIESHAFGMKSTNDALKLRNHLLKNFERAAVASSDIERQKLLTIVVAGAGATGVEISGAIADMRRFVLYKDFPEIDFKKMKIYLIDGTDAPLKTMGKKSSQKSLEYLNRLGIEFISLQKILSYDGEKILLENGQSIFTNTLIWSAGIIANVPDGIDAAKRTRANRIKVNEYHQVEGFENVFALGDTAFMQTEQYPNGHPQTASAANEQADNLAKNLLSLADAFQFKSPFRYLHKGTMATVGRNLAVADLPNRIHFSGALAWLFFMMVHLMLILGVKNRFFIFINWVYNYITYDQSLRLIFEDDNTKNE